MLLCRTFQCVGLALGAWLPGLLLSFTAISGCGSAPAGGGGASRGDSPGAVDDGSSDADGDAAGGDGPSAPLPKGQLLFSGLRSAILSVSGDDSGNIYAVGADLGEGNGPNFLRFDGTSWGRVSTPATEGNLWWISVTPIDGLFYMAGEPGLILSYDPATGVFEQFATPGEQSLFGIWGASADDLWAVGGDFDRPDDGGVIWHYDGVEWAETDTSDIAPTDTLPTVYKVWGRSADEVYAVGRLGLVLRYDGGAWSVVPCDTTRTLFTVHGNSNTLMACGGAFDAVIVENTDGTFASSAPQGLPQMNGVFVPEKGAAVAVGNTGAIAMRTQEGWLPQDTGIGTIHDFHGTWVDAEGGVWAVGGELSLELNDGMVAYFGPRTIPTDVVAGSE